LLLFQNEQKETGEIKNEQPVDRIVCQVAKKSKKRWKHWTGMKKVIHRHPWIELYTILVGLWTNSTNAEN